MLTAFDLPRGQNVAQMKQLAQRPLTAFLKSSSESL
jgi:hypothetical protein